MKIRGVVALANNQSSIFVLAGFNYLTIKVLTKKTQEFWVVSQNVGPPLGAAYVAELANRYVASMVYGRSQAGTPNIHEFVRGGSDA